MNQKKPIGCFGSIALGSVLVVAGTAAMLFLAKLYTLDCERLDPPTNVGECELSSEGIFGKESLSLPIASLENAEVDEKRSSDGDRTYRVVLITSEGTFPLSPSFSSGRTDKERTAREIRSFINTNTEISLYIEQDDRLFIYLIGGVFAGFGVLLIVSAPFALPRGRL